MTQHPKDLVPFYPFSSWGLGHHWIRYFPGILESISHLLGLDCSNDITDFLKLLCSTSTALTSVMASTNGIRTLFFIGGGDPVCTSEVRHLCVFRSFGTMGSEGAEWKVGREHATRSVD